LVDSFTPVAGKIAIAVLVAGVLAATAFAIFGGGDETPTPQYKTIAAVKPDLTNADPRLKAIVAQASELLPGGIDAYNKRIESLRGLPVVVNKWGSWCDPCRREFPAFQSAAKRLGNQVAFLGANVNDSKKDATKFMSVRPLPYPSYVDDKLKISSLMKPAGFAPVTVFYDTEGKLVHTHAGPYDNPAALENDIKKYIPDSSAE
jgi:thiol-disulfide isomerase/thioredoxin